MFVELQRSANTLVQRQQAHRAAQQLRAPAPPHLSGGSRRTMAASPSRHAASCSAISSMRGAKGASMASDASCGVGGRTRRAGPRCSTAHPGRPGAPRGTAPTSKPPASAHLVRIHQNHQPRQHIQHVAAEALRAEARLKREAVGGRERVHLCGAGGAGGQGCAPGCKEAGGAQVQSGQGAAGRVGLQGEPAQTQDARWPGAHQTGAPAAAAAGTRCCGWWPARLAACARTACSSLYRWAAAAWRTR